MALFRPLLAMLSMLSMLTTVVAVTNAQELPRIDRSARHPTVTAPLALISTSSARVVAVPTEWGGILLRQCSRATPGPADAYYYVTANEVPAAVAAVAKYFKTAPLPQDLHGWPDLASSSAQVIGVVRGGAKHLYFSFQPSSFDTTDEWRIHPIQMCDGGPEFFGVEVDPATAGIVHIAFDGCLCTVVPSNTSQERATFRELFGVEESEAAASFGVDAARCLADALEDFNLVLASKNPVHATTDDFSIATGGGTRAWRHACYQLMVLKSLTTLNLPDGTLIHGYLEGPSLTLKLGSGGWQPAPISRTRLTFLLRVAPGKSPEQSRER